MTPENLPPDTHPDATPVDTLRDDNRGSSADVLVRQSYLFVALEADRPLAGGARYSLQGLDEIVVVRGDDRTVQRDTRDGKKRLVLTLPGRWLSGIHARLSLSGGGWILTDAGSTNGTYVNGIREARTLLNAGDVIEVGHTFLLIGHFPRPANEVPTDRDSRHLSAIPGGFRTLVPTLEDRLGELARVAASPSSVVLSGPTGSGKEILARGVHELSGRAGPFIAINCGALTKGLVESQLFGHVKGSFSGAVADAPGFVRSAEGGTLLLDEIGDLDRSVQPVLLRVLQEREVVPVGGARPYRVDVRFVSASPCPLEDLVARGVLRADLLARLKTFAYAATPLGDRREDMGLLVAALLAKHTRNGSTQPRLAAELALSTLQYPWPLNVRELEQILLRGWTLAQDGFIDLPPLTTRPSPAGAAAPTGKVLSSEDDDLRRKLQDELRATDGNVAEVARRLGKARMQVQRWMKRFALDPESFRR